MKKLFSIILAITVFATAGSALASFNDTENHWAADSINTWSEYGVISGYDGSFAPDRSITRGEFAVVLNRLMNYKTTAENSFTDLGEAFYTDAILKLNKKGVISGYDGLVNPTGQLTREEASVMLCRALGIETADELSREFSDKDEISIWAKPYINTLVNRGLLNGYEGKLNPKNTITRAEVVTILNNAVYPVLKGEEKSGLTLDKILVISAGNVTITDFVANGNVIITEGAEEGTVVFKNTKINGHLNIDNERTSFIKLENSTVAYGEILKDDAIAEDSNATVDDTNATGGNVNVGGNTGGSGSGSTGGGSTGGSGSGSTGGGSTGGSGSGSTGGGSTGGSGSGSTGGGSTGGSGSGSTGGGSADKDDNIDYVSENAEVIEKIEYMSETLAPLLVNTNGTFDSREKALLKIINACMKDAITYQDKAIIDSKFLKTTYSDEIDKAQEIYEEIEFDGKAGEFHSTLVDNIEPDILIWLLDEFGLMDEYNDLV